MNIRFVIDESSWQFDQMTPLTCRDALDQLLDQIELALEHGHRVCYSEELFWQSVWQDKTFYELLAPDCGFLIPHEVNERLASIIYRLPKWQDLSATQPSSNQVTINGNAQQAASLSWAAQQTQTSQSNAVAALILPTRHPASLYVLGTTMGSIPIWLVADHTSYQDFFRWLICETSKNPTELAQWAKSAFLKLDFHDDALPGIKHMSKPFHELLPDLVRHLAALSDHGKAIFSHPWQEVPKRFGEHGVEMSQENGNTKSNAKARKQRTRTHKGEEVVFWWHSKLEPHQNRIHFYPDEAASTGRILVGILCKHLDT